MVLWWDERWDIITKLNVNFKIFPRSFEIYDEKKNVNKVSLILQICDI